MPSVLPTGDASAVPGGGQRPCRILGVWARSEEPSWEMWLRHLKWLGWHTRMGQDVQALLRSLGTCFAPRRSWTKLIKMSSSENRTLLLFTKTPQGKHYAKGLYKQKRHSASLTHDVV